MSRHTLVLALSLMPFYSSLSITTAAEAEIPYFAIHVVDDDQTNRGIPLVFLRTTFNAEYVTDSNGYVAFNEPALMDGQNIWFEVRSYGYESPPGAFGVKGIALKPSAGNTAEIRLKRTQIAERLYRLTGYGIYRDTVLLGITPPIKQPLLNAKVTGQDTIQTALYKGKYYWIWQDTSRLDFGLGGYSMTGATASALPKDIDPDRGIDFNYFVNKPNDFARPLAEIKRPGSNPVWVDGLTVTRDAKGNQRMLARYVAVNSKMQPLETGLVLFNDQRQTFEQFLKFNGNGESQLAPSGHPFRVVDGSTHYVYFNPSVRVADTFEAASDPSKYETFTCLSNDQGNAIDRDNTGKPRWTWQINRKRINDKQLKDLLDSGTVKPEDLPTQFVNIEDNKPIRIANGSIAWSPYLKLWTQIFEQSLGDTTAGEIWFATAKSPEGPWRAAKKIATHAMEKNPNDFYNPLQHEELSRHEGQFIYFEGTFVNTFSGNPHPTPYYNYNNLMYRLDLADPRLLLPDPPPPLSQALPE